MRYLCFVATVLSIGCSQFPKEADVSTLFPVAETESRTASSPPPPTSSVQDEPVWTEARQAEAKGDIAGAMQAYKDLTVRFPESVQPLHRLALLHDQHGSAEESTRLYGNALRLAPRDAALLTDYAYSRYLQGDLAVAKEMLQRALDVDARFKRAHNNLALVLVREGKDDEAVAAFQNGGLSRQQAQENLRQAKRAVQLSQQEKS